MLRQISWLNNDVSIDIVGFGSSPGIGISTYYQVKKNSGWNKIQLAFRLLFRRYETAYWGKSHVKKTLELITNNKYDLLIANDIEALPVALKLAAGSPVVFDAHEYYPGQQTDTFVQRQLLLGLDLYLCSHYIPRVSAFLTVCDGIAQLYRQEYGVEPIVITNAPNYVDLVPSVAADEGLVRLVHHGIAAPGRKLENMIDTMAALGEGYSLDFYLVIKEKSYFSWLQRYAKGKQVRVKFCEPVETPDLPVVLNQYDIGLYLLEATTINQKYALPNKLFEFIQARLAIAIGPSVEMAKVVNKYDLGVIGSDFTARALAGLVSGLSPQDISRYKANAEKAAIELNAENNGQIFLAVVDDCIKGNH